MSQEQIEVICINNVEYVPRSSLNQMEPDGIPFLIGEKYLIRTVTMTLTGKLKSKSDKFLVLSDADWIADTGRFSLALEDQDKFNEVEPFKNDAIVAVGAIVDATVISKLIRKIK